MRQNLLPVRNCRSGSATGWFHTPTSVHKHLSACWKQQSTCGQGGCDPGGLAVRRVAWPSGGRHLRCTVSAALGPRHLPKPAPSLSRQARNRREAAGADSRRRCQDDVSGAGDETSSRAVRRLGWRGHPVGDPGLPAPVGGATSSGGSSWPDGSASAGSSMSAGPSAVAAMTVRSIVTSVSPRPPRVMSS